MATLEAAQKQWQDIQNQLAAAVGTRQKLGAQLQENVSVEKELSMLPDDAKVFKAHGPVLLPQELSEAKHLVANRLKYIRGEIDRVEGTLKELQRKGQRVQSEILTLSNEPVQKQA